jgi:hypothetical protein
LNVLQVGSRLLAEAGTELTAEDVVYNAYNMHPHLHPVVLWNSLYALHSAERKVESPSDALALATQNVGIYKRKLDQ